MIEALVNVMVVIILQYISVSNQTYTLNLHNVPHQLHFYKAGNPITHDNYYINTSLGIYALL